VTGAALLQCRVHARDPCCVSRHFIQVLKFDKEVSSTKHNTVTSRHKQLCTTFALADGVHTMHACAVEHNCCTHQYPCPTYCSTVMITCHHTNYTSQHRMHVQPCLQEGCKSTTTPALPCRPCCHRQRVEPHGHAQAKVSYLGIPGMVPNLARYANHDAVQDKHSAMQTNPHA
jgi:hypothetical protein